jgi:hypothetical protein
MSFKAAEMAGLAPASFNIEHDSATVKKVAKSFFEPTASKSPTGVARGCCAKRLQAA